MDKRQPSPSSGAAQLEQQLGRVFQLVRTAWIQSHASSVEAADDDEARLAEPQLASYVDKIRRNGSEFTAALISRMFTGVRPGATGILAPDLARYIQSGGEFANDWLALSDFILRSHSNHQQAAERQAAKKRPTALPSSASLPPMRRPPWHSHPQTARSARPPPGESRSSGHSGSPPRSARDYAPFVEARHPTWSVHCAPLEATRPPPKMERRSTMCSVYSLTRGRGSIDQLALVLPSARSRHMVDFNKDAVAVCYERGETLDDGAGLPALRAVVVDLDRISGRFNQSPKSAALRAAGYRPKYGEFGTGGGRRAPSPRIPAPPPTRAQEKIVRRIINYIERDR